MVPIRPSVLMSLVEPSRAGKGKCTHVDCQRQQHCGGNTIQVGSSGGGMMLVAPHHKNEKRWAGRPICSPISPPLVHLLKAHISWGRTVLTQWQGEEEVHSYLFVHPKSGKPLTDACLSPLWIEYVLKGTGLSFGPQRARSIFVEERRREERVEGPSDPAAAKIMGNSVATWDKVYDKYYTSRMTGEAAAAMEGWREAMLAEAEAALQRERQQRLLQLHQGVVQLVQVVKPAHASAVMQQQQQQAGTSGAGGDSSSDSEREDSVMDLISD
jgi:hypothetical protein